MWQYSVSSFIFVLKSIDVNLFVLQRMEVNFVFPLTFSAVNEFESHANKTNDSAPLISNSPDKYFLLQDIDFTRFIASSVQATPDHVAGLFSS
ncbi:hypothetical protein SDC9_66491 [bioreactor metagenome]|uniref:Uncharacterized protein n=1 Tax=bioreactor metagenome TaxID=1076179 RepID=A0A644Y1F2_9ZZZZ